MQSKTLTRRTVYKNGGASYHMEGVRASVYCGPKMFAGDAPETIEFGATNLAEVAPPKPPPTPKEKKPVAAAAPPSPPKPPTGMKPPLPKP